MIGTTLSIADNDERGLTVAPTVLTLTEGTSATYTVVLDTEPTGTVTVSPTVSGSPGLTIEPENLTFTPSDWDTAQTMTVTATEDDDAYHGSSSVSHTTAGADYVAFSGGDIAITIADNEVELQGSTPAQVMDVNATATATHVDLTWSAVEDAVLGYRIEASYDGGANWAEVEASTESIEATFRHEVGLNFAETRLYRVSAVGENGAGLPSVTLLASATSTAAGLTAVVRSPEALSESMPGDLEEPMSGIAPDLSPGIDVCWIPQSVAVNELSAVEIAWSPVQLSRSGESSWQSVGSGSSEVDCEDGIGFRVTSISDNQRYAIRMRAEHDGVWLVSNEAQAVLADSSRPLRTIVTAGSSGLSGDTPAPELLCRNHDDPSTLEDEAGAFFLSIGFTTAGEEYLRYEPVNDFDPSTDLTLVNATAELLDRPYDTQLGYRIRVTPVVWGEPVAVSVAADVVTHAETAVGNQASGELRIETSDAEACDIADPEPLHRSQVTDVGIEQDGNRDSEWTAGEPIQVTLRFDERVVVDTTDGLPGVSLTLGEVQTTESSLEGEGATTQVTASFSHMVRADTLVFEHVVTAVESPVRDITLQVDSLVLNGGRIDSFSGPAVDLAHPGAVVVDGQLDQPVLTAGWSTIPGAHEGSGSAFEIHLGFSEAVEQIGVIGEQNLVEYAFTVTGGAIESIGPARDRQGEYLADEWILSVAPDSEEPVTIAPVVELACEEPGAICTIDDRPLTVAPAVTIHRTAQALSVADAEVGEGPGAVLEFEITLTRAAEESVTVDYVTADGSAIAGEDYEAVSGTLSIDAGQTGTIVQIPVIDDSHDEGEETLTLVLSNPSGAQIHDGEALGVIVNSDPIPGAWLSRFGRAASDHIAQAVARRLERGSGEEHLKVGGASLNRLFTNFTEPAAGRVASVSTPSGLHPLIPGASPVPGLRFSHTSAQPAGRGFGAGINSSTPMDPSGGPWSSGAGLAHEGGHSRTLGALPSLHDMLMGSSFFYTFGAGEDASSQSSGLLTAWGETATTRFSGSDGALSVDGDVTTATMGLDKQYGRWLVGTTLSYSEGEGGFGRSGALGGVVQSTLTSLNPYAYFKLNETTSLWGVIGYGEGRLRLTPQGAATAIETDLSNRMAAFGGRGLLSVRTGSAGRFELALRSDALLTHTDSQAVQGLKAAQGATSRVRLMLEGSGSLPIWGGTLRPTVEAGLWYDGGDAETGAGIELGGGLGYGSGRLSVQLNARGLVAHEDTDYKEWGLSGSLTYRSGTDGRGLAMNLGSVWGVTQSGVALMWSQANASGIARSGAAMDLARRFQVEFGYGLEGQKGRALWVPYVGAEAGQDGNRLLRMGVKLTSGSTMEAGFEIGQRAGGRAEAQQAVELNGIIRW